MRTYVMLKRISKDKDILNLTCVCIAFWAVLG